MIWNIAEPHTTKMNRASSHGPTGYFSSALFVDLGTLPRIVMFLLAFSLATLIRCWGAIIVPRFCVVRVKEKMCLKGECSDFRYRNVLLVRKG